MAAKSTFLAILSGVLVHGIYLASIFDIYFTSPLVHGMTPQKSRFEAPARRLVLFVADGLRADKFYELKDDGETRAPFLRKIIESVGCWGVSHTRVPTESRPGHVALIAGFYEDVSAVAKGWKENPVEFDSAFNESQFTWAWGSPDILPMFAKGASGSHVLVSMYHEGEEDFADKDASKLDSWVFDEVKKFFQQARINQTLKEMISSRQIVFFLHLLGIDTNGHAHRPTSDEYLKNIALVDSGIKEMFDLIEDYYDHDGQTAYIMTSDHGMTNWGSHGAGHAHETLTPLVAWGAGIRHAVPSTENVEEQTKQWKLEHIKRSDVNQADIAPLMTSLIGVNYPLNSVGILPTDYLNNSDKYVAENLFTNARQILAQYELKEDYRKRTSLIFRPFKQLSGATQIGMIRDIKEFLRGGNYEKVSALSRELMELALEGLSYYQNYDRVFLNVVVTLGFLGWISCIVLQILQKHTAVLKEVARHRKMPLQSLIEDRHVDLLFMILAIVGFLLLIAESAPKMYYLYCLLPFLFWNHVTKKLHVISATFQYVSLSNLQSKVISVLTLGAVSIEILVLSFFRRELLSVGLVFFAIWPLTTKLKASSVWIASSWFVFCLALAVFPLLPVVGREANYGLVTLAGFLSLSVVAMLMTYCYCSSDGLQEELKKTWRLLFLQAAIVCFSLYVVDSTSKSLALKKGVPILNHVGSWFILICSFVLPLFSSGNIALRLVSIMMSFMSVYLLMSTAYEGLFLLVLSLLMGTWLLCEHKLSLRALESLLDMQLSVDPSSQAHRPAWKVLTEGLSYPTTRHLTLEDLRCVYFFVFFIITAFYGTGNIASINSFDPASVYCFLTVFSPFTMGALLLCKVVIPFIIVTCTLDAIHVVLQVPVHSLFLLVLVITDLMGLHFFYLVKDYGSWLEIGTSISHYVIMMAFIIFLLLIFGLARLFTGASLTINLLKKRM